MNGSEQVIASFQSTPSSRRATYARFIKGVIHVKFQSTPSSRRATPERQEKTVRIRHFNPHPPHGGRHVLAEIVKPDHNISIHTLLTEGDVKFAIPDENYTTFQSTPSSRRATFGIFPALHSRPHFNPHPPHGGRLQK